MAGSRNELPSFKDGSFNLVLLVLLQFGSSNPVLLLIALRRATLRTTLKSRAKRALN